MTVRYSPDYAGTRALMNSPEMVTVMEQVATEVMTRAVSAAPERTGEYRSSFSVIAHENGGIRNDRAEGLVINDSGHAVLVEWWDGFHTLRDAAEELEAR